MAGESEENKNFFPITIDKEGVWYYKGAEMFRKDILELFFDTLGKDEDGNYFVRMSGKNYYISVEDTAFVVRSVYTRSGEATDSNNLEIMLSDGSIEPLDISSLRIKGDNIMYVNVKNKNFEARFSRAAYYQIAEFIVSDEKTGRFAIAVNGKRYPVNIKN
ncbi:MAG: DUF1285 domain-containing protein [Syntrophales bacterium]|jgi:hypothetical protein|nr:DUF1285 domain-containing protein [Syntrophales bacterium]MDY0045141.1 DUF1285 domain-containing protein [Syntrophales bacterium]